MVKANYSGCISTSAEYYESKIKRAGLGLKNIISKTIKSITLISTNKHLDKKKFQNFQFHNATILIS